MLKLPIAIAAYKQAENDPSFLKKQAIYTKELDAINDAVVANSESSLVIGRAYSVEDLVKIMLTQSDNGAKNLLITTLNRGYLDTLFALVSLDDPQTSTTYHISSIEYALFLRMLYGASYLNEDDSDLLLSYLTESTFGDGLVAGLPKNISIAHKYGVYQFEDTSNGKALLVQQLNDCGVIYHAQRPYLVCMMTKGKDLESLYRIYKYVSSTIYNDQEQEDE